LIDDDDDDDDDDGMYQDVAKCKKELRVQIKLERENGACI
jgi:hypothetical protein